MFIGEFEVVNVRGKFLIKVDYIIVDSIKFIKFLVWENKVVFEVDKFYYIEGISVRSFNDEKYLIIIKYTLIYLIEEFVVVNDVQCDYGNVVVGLVLGVSVFYYKICFCNIKIQVVDNIIIVKCNKCKFIVFVNVLFDSFVIKLIIKDNLSQMYIYIVLNIIMDMFLYKVVNKFVIDCDDEQFLEIFVYKIFEFIVSEKEKFVSSIIVNILM